MDISERIERIKQYFVSFNVMAQDDASYILLRLPSTWVIPNTKALKETYAVEVAVRDEGVYFLTEIANGTDKLFECAETVVKYNKNIEERKYLLKARIEELSDLFATEELEKLKTLQFTFGDKPAETPAENADKKCKGKGKKVTKATTEDPQYAEGIPQPSEPTVSSTGSSPSSDDEDNGLMALAKDITGE